MTLPLDADKRIAIMEGWEWSLVAHGSNNYHAWVHDEHGWSDTLPRYTTDPSAILPVLTRRCPGWIAGPLLDGRTLIKIKSVAAPIAGNIYDPVAGFCEAACAAVLAQAEHDAGAGGDKE